MSWWSDVVLAVESALGGESNVVNTAGPATASVPSGLGPLITTIEGIWAALTDGKLWRSLGWLLLGITLMLMGASWWVGERAPLPPVVL
jgi:hypothetical protein